MRTGFFSTDTQLDVVESLETALEYSYRESTDPYKWKWFVIALHSAAQGAMVLVLERGNGLQTLTARSRAKWLKAYETGQELPDVQLNLFLELYEDIKTDAALPYVHSTKFTAEKRHNAAMKKLNDLRNKWIHFTPKTWSIESLYVARVALDVLEVLSFLLVKSQAFFWNHRGLAEKTTALLESLNSTLTQIENRESAS